MWVEFLTERGHLALEKARQVPTDVYLALIGYCSLVAFLALLAWGRASSRRRAATRTVTALQGELSELKEKYEGEVWWRMIGEAQAAKKRVEPPRPEAEPVSAEPLP